MQILKKAEIGHKFIFGFLFVVFSVIVITHIVKMFGYSQLLTDLLTYSISMVFGLVLGWFFSKKFTQNFSRLSKSTEALCQGDLTHNVYLPKTFLPDETHDMARSINIMVDSLRDLVMHVKMASVKVSDSAKTLSSSAIEINASTEEVAQAIEQISKGAETQAEMVERCSKAIREMAISIELVAGKAKEASKAAKDTSRAAEKGGDVTRESLDKTRQLLGLVEANGQRFMQFNSRLQQVGKIADVINEIARQTNLLALNASIEAARAGEFGKGFAVVADEVRKLADGSSRSAAEIIDIIAAIKDESLKVQESIGETSRQISDGKRNIDSAAASFDEIMATVLETERKANSIADLSQMQTEGAERMVKAMDEIANVAEDNAASTEEVSAATEEQSAAMQEMTYAAQELAALSDELLKVVERFKTAREETAA